jgi:DNA helicase-2/ATP-dependent DNA helicase PcrA
MSDSNAIPNLVPNLKYNSQEITKSYRSTYEIMTFARRALLSVPRKGRPVALPEPLKRHGASPQMHNVQNADELSNALAQVLSQIQENGYRNIAVICKTSARCSVIADLLTLKGVDFRLATSFDFKYEGGIVIVPVHLAKGMEFEASLVVDADAQTYTETEFDGRLLYVALTRALHVLDVFWIGQISKHLEKVVVPQG